ncbi:hypothetical protein SDJN02_27685, partial [Cucurbita argyrosperma subsp. argyrosperma]
SRSYITMGGKITEIFVIMVEIVRGLIRVDDDKASSLMCKLE